MAITINGSGTIAGISAGGLPLGAGGKFAQIVQAVKTDTASVTGGTFADVGLSAAITPSSSSSKILILVQANIAGDVGYSAKGRLMRGSTAIHIGDAAGNRPRATAEFTSTYSDSGNYNAAQVNMMFLDSPSTTSSTTYKIQYASYDSFVAYINRSGSDSNDTEFDARTASSITLIEVAA